MSSAEPRIYITPSKKVLYWLQKSSDMALLSDFPLTHGVSHCDSDARPEPVLCFIVDTIDLIKSCFSAILCTAPSTTLMCCICNILTVIVFKDTQR